MKLNTEPTVLAIALLLVLLLGIGLCLQSEGRDPVSSLAKLKPVGVQASTVLAYMHRNDPVVSTTTPTTVSTTRSSTRGSYTPRVRAYTRTTYQYSGGRGSGDCWSNSNQLYNQLTSRGEKARIIQYSTSQSSRHRSVQVYKNGKWTNYNYKKAGYKSTYYATSNSKNGVVVKS